MWARPHRAVGQPAICQTTRRQRGCSTRRCCWWCIHRACCGCWPRGRWRAGHVETAAGWRAVTGPVWKHRHGCAGGAGAGLAPVSSASARRKSTLSMRCRHPENPACAAAAGAAAGQVPPVLAGQYWLHPCALPMSTTRRWTSHRDRHHRRRACSPYHLHRREKPAYRALSSWLCSLLLFGQLPRERHRLAPERTETCANGAPAELVCSWEPPLWKSAEVAVCGAQHADGHTSEQHGVASGLWTLLKSKVDASDEYTYQPR